jgi:hypothetical protein
MSITERSLFLQRIFRFLSSEEKKLGVIVECPLALKRLRLKFDNLWNWSRSNPIFFGNIAVA